MDFRRKTRPKVEHKVESKDLQLNYPHSVLLYRLPPIEDIQIQEFEELALERLKVLRIFEQAGSKGLRFLSADWKEYINAELTRESLRGYLRLCMATSDDVGSSESKRESDMNARRKDYVSHFILRLAYCRTETLRRWFLAREMELFKYKFSSLSPVGIKQFLELNKLNYSLLSDKEKDDVKDGLYESTMGQSVTKIELLDFFKIPFTQVLDLVRARRCYLKEGFAYVNTHDLISVVSTLHLREIEHGLQSAQRLIQDVETDERIFHILKSLHTSYVGKDYTVNKDNAIAIETLDQLAKKSYALCMRNCHEHLRAQHHLKHSGRMQYGLFLKGIGVTLEDSLRFWREEFSKKMNADEFTKRYEYNIYHNYGKRGSMVNYTPYSCLKIIQENVAPGDAHGCPYKTYDPVSLKTKLTAYGLGAGHIQEIMSFVSKGHYQLACGKFFQVTHNSTEVGINHPNQYFEESLNVMGNRSQKVGTPTAKKGGRNSQKEALNADEDDELWSTAAAWESEEAEKTVWDEDLDLVAIDC